MVTIAEALQQAEKSESSASQRGKEIREAEARARKIRVGGTVAEQFRFGTGLSGARRQATRQRKEALSQIGIAKEELGIFRGQIAERRAEIKSVQSAQSRQQSEVSKFNNALRVARRFVGRGNFPVGESKLVKEIFAELKEGQNIQLKRVEQLATLREQGLDPVFVGGQLRGFGSEQLGISFELQDLPEFQPRAVSRLEEVGVVSIERQLAQPDFQQLSLQSTEELGPDSPLQSREPVRGPTFFERVKTEAEGSSFAQIGESLRSRRGLGGLATISDISIIPAATVAVLGQDISKTITTPEFKQGASIRQPNIIDVFGPTGFRDASRDLTEISTGLGLETLSVLIPQTTEQVAIQTILPFAFKGLSIIPKVGSLLTRGASTGIGVVGGVTAFDPEATLPERVAGGLIGSAGFTGATIQPTRFQLGIRELKTDIRGLGQAGVLSSRGESAALGLVGELKFFRGQPDVPIIKPIAEIIPKGLTQLESEAFGKVLLAEDVRIFGGQAESLRGIRLTKDIDIGAKESQRIIGELGIQLREVSSKPVVQRSEAIGFGSDKAFDIKPIARLTEFQLSQRPVTTLEGVEVTRLSEQLSRSLAGTFQLRKGGKDIGSTILDTRAFLTQASNRLGETTFPFLRPFRQRALARVERRVEAFEQFTLPDIRSQVETFGRTPSGRGVGIIDLPPRFRATTPTPGFVELGIEFERLLPAGRRGQLGGLIDSRLVAKPIRVRGKIRQPRPSEFDISILPSRITPSILGPLPSVFPSSFKPSTLGPSKISGGLGPSDFNIIPSDRIRGSIFGGPPSQFKGPPGITTLGPPSTFPGFDIGSDPLGGRPIVTRRDTQRRKVTRRRPRTRRQLEFPISVSFTAVAADLFGTFPTVRSPGLGLTPGQIRFQPLRRAPRRRSLAGVRTRVTKRTKKKRR